MLCESIALTQLFLMVCAVTTLTYSTVVRLLDFIVAITMTFYANRESVGVRKRIGSQYKQ